MEKLVGITPGPPDAEEDERESPRRKPGWPGRVCTKGVPPKANTESAHQGVILYWMFQLAQLSLRRKRECTHGCLKLAL